MNKVVTLHTRKGGGGKTTNTLTLFGAAIQLGYSCAAIDMDNDKADLYKWASQSEILKDHIYQYSDPDYESFKIFIEALKSKYDLIFIDTPPNQTKECPYSHLFALKQSNLVIIPVLGGKMEEREFFNSKAVCEMEDKDYIILFSRWNNTFNLNKSIRDNLLEYKSFNNYITQSIKFVDAEAYGLHPFEMESFQEKDKKMIKNLMLEIIDFLKADT